MILATLPTKEMVLAEQRHLEKYLKAATTHNTRLSYGSQ